MITYKKFRSPETLKMKVFIDGLTPEGQPKPFFCESGFMAMVKWPPYLKPDQIEKMEKELKNDLLKKYDLEYGRINWKTLLKELNRV